MFKKFVIRQQPLITGDSATNVTTNDDEYYVEPILGFMGFHKHFLNGLRKLQSNSEKSLTTSEEEVLRKFKKPPFSPIIVEVAQDKNNTDKIIDRVRKKVKEKQKSAVFRNTEYVAPTSNVAERCFSVCKLVDS